MVQTEAEKSLRPLSPNRTSLTSGLDSSGYASGKSKSTTSRPETRRKVRGPSGLKKSSARTRKPTSMSTVGGAPASSLPLPPRDFVIEAMDYIETFIGTRDLLHPRYAFYAPKLSEIQQLSQLDSEWAKRRASMLVSNLSLAASANSQQDTTYPNTNNAAPISSGSVVEEARSEMHWLTKRWDTEETEYAKTFSQIQMLCSKPDDQASISQAKELVENLVKPKTRPQGEKKRGRRAQALLDQQGKKVNAGSLW